MTTCANCSSEATFSYSVSADFSIPYCSRHVPKFLQAQRFSGALHTITAPVVVEEKTSKKKKVSATVEETVVEEAPVVEETPVIEEPAPSEE